MAYTTHGFHIPGTQVYSKPPRMARCGGIKRCGVCTEEAARVIGTMISEEDENNMEQNTRQMILSEDAELRIAAMELSLSFHANKVSNFPATDRDIVSSAEEFYKFLAGK